MHRLRAAARKRDRRSVSLLRLARGAAFAMATLGISIASLIRYPPAAAEDCVLPACSPAGSPLWLRSVAALSGSLSELAGTAEPLSEQQAGERSPRNGSQARSPHEQAQVPEEIELCDGPSDRAALHCLEYLKVRNRILHQPMRGQGALPSR